MKLLPKKEKPLSFGLKKYWIKSEIKIISLPNKVSTYDKFNKQTGDGSLFDNKPLAVLQDPGILKKSVGYHL